MFKVEWHCYTTETLRFLWKNAEGNDIMSMGRKFYDIEIERSYLIESKK